MKRFGVALAIAVGLWVAGGLQQVVAPRLMLFGAAPDFLLISLAAGSLFLKRNQAAFLGFVCGLIHGALAGANLTHYVISRTIGGFLAAWSRTRTLEPNAVLAVGTGFFMTLVSQVLFMFLSPPKTGLWPYLGATILTAAYNGVLVLPVYLLLKWLRGAPRP